jgi:Flp pilus assembly pilin Flp
VKAWRAIISDSRGAATVEYIVLVGTVGLVVMAALVAIGPVLIADYETTRSVVAAPFP